MNTSTSKIFIFFILTYLALASLNGLVTIFAYNTTRLILLYKDFFSIVFPLLMIFFFVANGYKAGRQFTTLMLTLLAICFFILSYILATLLFSKFDMTRIAIQFRVELFAISAILIAALASMFSTEEKKNIVSVFIKFYIIFCSINALATIAEFFSAELIFQVLGFNPGPMLTAFGKDNGLVLRTTDGYLRALGLLTTPFSLSEYLFFGLALASFVSAKRRALFTFLMIAGILCSTSKTAFVMMVIYVLYMIINRLVSNQRALRFITWITVVVSIVFFLSVTNTFIYEVFSSKENTYAENSIFLRILYIEQVLDSAYSIYFGSGYAVNGSGMVGVEDNTTAIPLDSLYIYLLSNYGFVGVLVFVFGAFLLLVSLYKKTSTVLPHGVYLYWLISLLTNFAYNNPFTNYPGYIFPIIITALLVSLKPEEYSDEEGSANPVYTKVS
ncbi:hypothetical protein I5N09_06055 [Serratia marcescens]|jgi:hypothetical protein|uniref:O-antigen polymerase n=1 Tax=Serratia marcescens TaxID=615 RepID=A0ABD6HLZ2_SERMA|nr:hypothetical protein [Serratia marcescens]KMJ16075.1 hypothetical protein SN04_00653 [Serratia marcescens]MBH3098366.1 hypothetical protein [Serratia marcescens]MBH3217579.1 hypothetical protein [Serratia marcescens]MVF02285.1 hypothetical protein [Serratia marcescens]NGH08167.1 hypothetical protein [Serratia marcescens]